MLGFVNHLHTNMAMSLRDQFQLTFLDNDNWMLYVEGLKNTLIVTFFALMIGVLLGSIIAAIRSTYDKTYSEMRNGIGKLILLLLNTICKIYLTVIRGTPVVVQIMIMYYIIFVSSNNKILIAALAFGVNSGAYVAEIIRSGIMSIIRDSLRQDGVSDLTIYIRCSILLCRRR